MEIIREIGNTLLSTWAITLIIATAITICRCFEIYSNNKLKGRGYVAQYLSSIKDDPEVRKRLLEWIKKTEEAMEKEHQTIQKEREKAEGKK